MDAWRRAELAIGDFLEALAVVCTLQPRRIAVASKARTTAVLFAKVADVRAGFCALKVVQFIQWAVSG
jgi:hypothetical protein